MPIVRLPEDDTIAQKTPAKDVVNTRRASSTEKAFDVRFATGTVSARERTPPPIKLIPSEFPAIEANTSVSISIPMATTVNFRGFSTAFVIILKSESNMDYNIFCAIIETN